MRVTRVQASAQMPKKMSPGKLVWRAREGARRCQIGQSARSSLGVAVRMLNVIIQITQPTFNTRRTRLDFSARSA